MRKCFRFALSRRGLTTAGLLVVVIAGFYVQQNWTGRHAWEKYKEKLKAEGENLDWNAYVPAPVPDDQNIFAAPKIQQWFVKGQSSDLSIPPYPPGQSVEIARVEVVGGEFKPESYDLILDDPRKVEVHSTSTTRDQVAVAIRKAARGRSLKSCIENTFIGGAVEGVVPTRILVKAQDIPSCKDIGSLFRPETIEAGFPGAKRVEVEALGSNSFSVYVPSVISARDYLEWSDRLEPKLSMIRSALERPFSRMNGAYDVPFKIPIPNFIAVRQVSQILAQRAQCHLLVNEPDKALQDLTLLHKLSRLLEAGPGGKPMTLVAAMINVAITGVYANTIGDGLRLHAWREPQLIELQRELAEVNLPPLVAEAFREERAGVCHTLETIAPTKLSLLLSGKASTTVWQKMRDPRFWLLSQMPRGWVYENMITVASLDQGLLAGFGARGVVQPKVVDEAMIHVGKTLGHFSPANFIAAQVVPNYLRATRTTAYNQTMANLALIACALERYRAVHNAYPISLEELTPGFIENVPSDVVMGIPLHYRLQDSGLYILYSVGWNGTDDGGHSANAKPGFPGAIDEADWVWEATRG